MAEACVQFEEVKPAKRKIGGKVPVGRSGHCCAADDANLYVYGGFNPDEGPRVANTHPAVSLVSLVSRQVMTEVWRFNFATRAWTKISKNSEQKHVTGASACCTMLPGRLLVYGGTMKPWGKKSSNTLSIFNVKTGEWQVVPVTSSGDEDMPRQAYGQSLVMHQGFVYVFTGATSTADEPISELHRLELKTGTWKKMSTEGSAPDGRYKQEMVLYKDRYLLVLGGGGQFLSKSLNVVHAYDLSTDQWETWKCQEDLQRGFPVSRASFACQLLDDYLYVLGGRHYMKQQGEWILNSCWQLNLDTLSWKRMHLSLPMDLSFPTSCVSPAGYIYLFGGIMDNDKRSKKLFRVRLFVPMLKEICWDFLTGQIKNISRKHIPSLKSAGIPDNFLNRLE